MGAKFFQRSCEEEREHAEKLTAYQNMRGGITTYESIKAPVSDWKSATNALEAALELDKAAEEANDPQMGDFLEGEFLKEQVEAMEKLAHLLTNLKRCGGDGLGLYLFDKEMGEQA